MWRGVLLGGLLFGAGLAHADVYKCVEKGKAMYQDQPCADASAEPLLQGVHTSPSSEGRRATPKAAVLEPALSTEPTADFTAKECMKINDIRGREGRVTKYAVEVDWKVDVSNRCKRPFQIWVRYAVYDKQGFELDHDVQQLRVPSGDIGTATGHLLIRPPEKMRHGTTSAARISLQTPE